MTGYNINRAEMVRSNISDTEALRISTCQGSKNSETVSGKAPTFPTVETLQLFDGNQPFWMTKFKILKKVYKIKMNEQGLLCYRLDKFCTQG